MTPISPHDDEQTSSTDDATTKPQFPWLTILDSAEDVISTVRSRYGEGLRCSSMRERSMSEPCGAGGLVQRALPPPRMIGGWKMIGSGFRIRVKSCGLLKIIGRFDST